jgi:hypothetical protein
MQQLHIGYEITLIHYIKTLFMKRRFSFLWAAFALLVTFALLIALPGCGPYIPSNGTAESALGKSALVRIECRDAPDVRQSVLMLLRSGRGKDISIGSDGSFLEITAAFSPTDTPSDRFAHILEDLNHTNGVIHVEIVENPHPIRQNF